MKTIAIIECLLFLTITSRAQINTIPRTEDMCAYCREHAPAKGPENYAVFSLMFKVAGIKYTDPNRDEVFQKWWKDNYSKISCTDGDIYQVPDGGLLKSIVMRDFEMGLRTMVKVYHLDMNVKDPLDGLTIMDWIQQELKKEQSKPDLELLQKYDKIFRGYGAKTTEELNGKN
ncbi:MAG: hypothetical protein WCK92_11530 [Bacteroidota bacterium]